MAWKLLKLTPLKPFFFGKESVFTNTNYASSEYFPQQTQITGALRLYWMEQNNLMRVHKDGKYVPYEKKEEARTLVGNAGALDFDVNEHLGALLGVSPMFILKSQGRCIQDALFEIPSDVVKKACQNVIAKPKHLQNIISSKPVVLLENYDAKESFESGLGGHDFWKNYIAYESLPSIYSYDAIYEAYEQVGIALTKEKQTQEGKFYTKRSYRLKEDYSFGVLVEIDDALLKEKAYKSLQDGVISLGADSSMFKLEVLAIPATIVQHPLLLSIQNPYKKEGTKLVLLSDSILTYSKQEKSYFQIVRHKVPFKMMQSKQTNEASLGQIDLEPKEHRDSYSKTTEKLLVPKGSVYYFKSKETLEEAKCAYKKMGFNQFLAIN